MLKEYSFSFQQSHAVGQDIIHERAVAYRFIESPK